MGPPALTSPPHTGKLGPTNGFQSGVDPKHSHERTFHFFRQSPVSCPAPPSKGHQAGCPPHPLPRAERRRQEGGAGAPGLGGEEVWEGSTCGNCSPRLDIGCRELGGSRKPARGSSHSHTYTLPANSLRSQIEHSGVSSNCHPMLTLHTLRHVCSHPLVELLSSGGAQTQKLRQASPLPSPGSCCVFSPSDWGACCEWVVSLSL